MTRIPLNDLSLNVVAEGTGRPLVLLHGFTGSAATWRPFIPALGRVRRVIAVDLPGHGSSDSPSDPARYRMERCVEDLTALLDRLGADQYDLLGYSMGGRVALHLALAHGDRVGTLMLESASPGIADETERDARRRQDEALAQMLEREGLGRFVEYWEALPLFATQASLNEAARTRLRRQRLGASPTGLAGSLRGMGAGVPEPVHQRLSELRGALLIAGALDEKYRALALAMGDAIPGARVAIVDGAGHAVHLEQPEAFLRLVLNALQANGAASPGGRVGTAL